MQLILESVPTGAAVKVGRFGLELAEISGAVAVKDGRFQIIFFGTDDRPYILVAEELSDRFEVTEHAPYLTAEEALAYDVEELLGRIEALEAEGRLTVRELTDDEIATLLDG
jgi:hypothetical protein